MGNFGTEVVATANQAPSVYDHFKDHCSDHRTDTNLAVTESIRTAHPDCQVTSISSRSCDLTGFAKAGHATVRLQTQGDDYLFQRTYQAPSSRLHGGDGDLSDKVSFGCYDLQYVDHRLQFYVAEWTENGNVRNYYILSPKSSVDASAHAPAVDAVLLASCKWTSELHHEIYVFDSGRWVKNRELWSAVQSSSWDDVILDPRMKETLIADVQGFFDSRAVYEEYAVPWKRGIIFHGTPGCGKTISIKALMNTLEKRDPPVAGLYVKSFEASQGQQYGIRTIFSHARVMAPCLLIFEDLDSLIVDKVRSYFLNEVDGLEDNNGILMIGSTNHLERLDPGISKRPSRFDRKYHYHLPGQRERVLYCEYWKKKLARNSNIDFDPAISDAVAQMTEGFSFAYMKELFVQALLTIVGGQEHEVDMEKAELERLADATKVIDDSAKLATGEDKTGSTAEEIQNGKNHYNKVATPERPIPSISIPEHLESNSLMRILHKQLIALWKDMDNSKDEGAGIQKIPGPANERAVRMAVRAARAS